MTVGLTEWHIILKIDIISVPMYNIFENCKKYDEKMNRPILSLKIDKWGLIWMNSNFLNASYIYI